MGGRHASGVVFGRAGWRWTGSGGSGSGSYILVGGRDSFFFYAGASYQEVINMC